MKHREFLVQNKAAYLFALEQVSHLALLNTRKYSSPLAIDLLDKHREALGEITKATVARLVNGVIEQQKAQGVDLGEFIDPARVDVLEMSAVARGMVGSSLFLIARNKDGQKENIFCRLATAQHFVADEAQEKQQ